MAVGARFSSLVALAALAGGAIEAGAARADDGGKGRAGDAGVARLVGSDRGERDGEEAGEAGDPGEGGEGADTDERVDEVPARNTLTVTAPAQPVHPDQKPGGVAPSLASGKIDYGPGREEGLIALTFDDGPSAQTTPQVLDELARRNAHATFFVNSYRLGGHSENAERQRGLLREEVARGHTVGNHTFDHQRLSDISPELQEKEIVDGEHGIRDVLGARPWLFRPPYGRLTPESQRILSARGYTVVQWNLSSEDPYLRQPRKVVAQVLRELRREGGGVLLMHDTHPWTVQALPLLLDAIEDESCRRVAEGSAPYLLVGLDRFFRPRYGPVPSATDARRGDREARQEIADRCARFQGPPKPQ